MQARPCTQRPNQVWTIDFKGWWRTRDRGRFEPLTVRDDFSRFILCAKCLGSTRIGPAREALEELFAAYGLPEIIRSDNGSPFGAVRSPFGLSRLSAWWLSLGIDLDRSRPGKPQDNGGHERMHRDLSQVEHTGLNRPAQQAALDEWRKEFNHERPHESLSMRVPADVFERSDRAFDSAALELSYPAGYLVRQVSASGTVSISAEVIRVSQAFAGYQVGLESLAADRYWVWFGQLCVGELDVGPGPASSTGVGSQVAPQQSLVFRAGNRA